MEERVGNVLASYNEDSASEGNNQNQKETQAKNQSTNEPTILVCTGLDRAILLDSRVVFIDRRVAHSELARLGESGKIERHSEGLKPPEIAQLHQLQIKNSNAADEKLFPSTDRNEVLF